MSITLITQTDAACKRVNRVASRLDNLSRAFSLIGNETLSRELIDLCTDLDTSVKEVKDAVADKITGDLKESQQSAKAVVGAVLAGMTIARTESSQS